MWLLEKPEEHYGSRIEEVNSDNLVIAMPMSKGYPVMLPRGDNFVAKLIFEGIVYQFMCTLLSKKVHPLPLWVVSLPFDIKKVQLRSFVRIASSLPVKLKIVLPETGNPVNAGEVTENPEYSLATKDISGGGIQVVSKYALKPGAKVEVNMDIPGSGAITSMGEVVRLQQPQPDNPVFWVGIKFTDIQEKDRSKIIKYIFKKQLEQRQKGI